MSDEELQCIICCNDYNRTRRIPRLLHCDHTFCTPCLTKLACFDGCIFTVRCPVCRWITCIRAVLCVSVGLCINIEMWDKLKSVNYLEIQEPDLETQKPQVSKSHLSAFKRLFKLRPWYKKNRRTAADERAALPRNREFGKDESELWRFI